MSTNLAELLRQLRQRDTGLIAVVNSKSSGIRRLEGNIWSLSDPARLLSEPFSVCREFLIKNRSLFCDIDVQNKLSENQAVHDQHGMVHVLFDQNCTPPLVPLRQVSFHFRTDGRLLRIESSLEPIESLSLSFSPTLSSLEAFSAAVKHLGWSTDAIHDDSFPARLVMCRPDRAAEGDDLDRFRLCWMMRIALHERSPVADNIVFIDATNGTLVTHYSAIQGGGYYSNNITAALNSREVTQANSTTIYQLIDEATSAGWSANPPKIYTYDAGGESYLNPAGYSYSSDTDGNWEDAAITVNRWDNQGPEVDVHRFLGIALTYFHHLDTLNIQTRTGNAPWQEDTHAIVHYGTNTLPSFWDPYYLSMYFGDGTSSDRQCEQDHSTRDYITTLDAVAHEFTHAILTRLQILQNYAKERASLNEAICDFFAYVIQSKNSGSSGKPYEYGYRYFIPPKPQGDPPERIRSIMNPSCTDPGNVCKYPGNATDYDKKTFYEKGYTCDHYSERMLDPNDLYPQTTIYCNSTIISHALYLMANGGTHRLGTTVTAIGHDIVANIVYHALACNEDYVNDSTVFECFRQRMLSSCQEMYHDSQLCMYLTSIKTAFLAVGVGHDLYIRDTPTDVGQEPGTLNAMSPDIILRREKADPNTTLVQIEDITNANLCETIELGATRNKSR